jgi:hypothetical protein
MGTSQSQDVDNVINKITPVLLMLAGLVLAGCSGRMTETATIEPVEAYQIGITGVTINQGDKIEISGLTTLPDGNCVYTRLSRDGADVDWWPVGKCFPISGPNWRFSIPLGVEGAPTDLDPQAAYSISVWWMGAPEVTQAEFPFDLTAPPVP